MKRVVGGREENAARGRTAELHHYDTIKGPARLGSRTPDIKVSYGQ